MQLPASSTQTRLKATMQQNYIYRPYKDYHQVDPLRPIFYIIRHIPSGKYYAGYKTNKKQFMTEGGYCTSSKIVKEIIKNEGLNAFEIIKIRYFQNGKDAHGYEVRFLKKVSAEQNTLFLNENNGGLNWSRVGKKHSIESRMKMSEKANGRTISLETRQKISKGIKGLMIGEKNPMFGKTKELNPFFGKIHTQEARQIMSQYAKNRIGRHQSDYQKQTASKRIGGSIYIYHPTSEQMKRIRPEELQIYLLDGWKEGMFKRKLK
jgi:hypothetical protein